MVKFTEQTDGRYLENGRKEVKHALRNRLMKVCDCLDDMWLDLQATYERIHALEAQGVSEATTHWRRKGEPGKPDILELLHPTGSKYEKDTGRRREYVGTDPEKQTEAIDRVKRWQEYNDAKSQAQKIKNKMSDIIGKIKLLEWAALGEQRSFGDEWHLLAAAGRPHSQNE